MAPIKQRNAPARNGVYPYCEIGFRMSKVSNQPPSSGPSKRAVLPADWRTPRARPCQLASTICDASPLSGGLAKPLPADNPAETSRRKARLLLIGNNASDTVVKIIPVRASATSPNVFISRPMSPPCTITLTIPTKPKR